ncbi:sulfiredoxin [Kwoniella heveanensis CBS 569]|uniref:sulfiredoxin n=1 Tax=Kwoniella heveanensis BCC8398 TaxID=1296120 RepID=A0A1B9GL53_9TREE|nr:sulfiredoxin [Kwoniella heveanensis BCC8398]OCF45685.1 sulfiredoxin [Kwoniella heveanensis CBS 569]
MSDPSQARARQSPQPQNSSTCLPEALRPQEVHQQHQQQVPSLSSAKGAPPSTSTDRPTSSIFSRSDSAPVHNVPMRVIRRPLPSELDEDKVLTFMEEMKGGDTFTPIELVKVKSPLKINPTGPPQVFYFAMGGCHRYEATKRLGLETIRARIIEVPASQMRVYLGAGSPF